MQVQAAYIPLWVSDGIIAQVFDNSTMKPTSIAPTPDGAGNYKALVKQFSNDNILTRKEEEVIKDKVKNRTDVKVH